MSPSALSMWMSRPDTEWGPRETCPLCRAEQEPLQGTLGSVQSRYAAGSHCTPLFPLYQLSRPLPQFYTCSGPVMTTLHACAALRSLHCTKCESPLTYVRRAEQDFLPVVQRTRLRPGKGWQEAPSGGVAFGLCLGSWLHKQQLMRGHLTFNRHVV